MFSVQTFGFPWFTLRYSCSAPCILDTCSILHFTDQRNKREKLCMPDASVSSPSASFLQSLARALGFSFKVHQGVVSLTTPSRSSVAYVAGHTVIVQEGITGDQKPLQVRLRQQQPPCAHSSILAPTPLPMHIRATRMQSLALWPLGTSPCWYRRMPGRDPSSSSGTRRSWPPFGPLRTHRATVCACRLAYPACYPCRCSRGL